MKALIKDIFQLPEKRKANRKELCEFMGVDGSTIDNWIAAGMPFLHRPPPGRGGGEEWVFDTKECAEWNIKRAYADIEGDIDPLKLLPADRQKWFDSELKRVQLNEKTKKLIPYEVIEELTATAFSVISQNLRSIPDNLERKFQLKPGILEEIEKQIDGQLDLLSESLTQTDMPDKSNGV